MTQRLIILTGNGYNIDGNAISIYNLKRDHVRIGRLDAEKNLKPDLELRTKENEVSRFHAEILYNGQRENGMNKYVLVCRSENKGLGILRIYSEGNEPNIRLCTVLKKDERLELTNDSVICFLPGGIARLYYKEDDLSMLNLECNKLNTCKLNKHLEEKNSLEIDWQNALLGCSYVDEVLNDYQYTVTLDDHVISFHTDDNSWKLFRFLYSKSIETDSRGQLMERYFTHNEISETVFNSEVEIPQAILRLRNKLWANKVNKSYIENRQGVGYRFNKCPNK